MTPDSDLPPILNQSYETEAKSLLLDQYKLYVEMHDRISARRTQSNSFFISLLSALLAVFSIVSNQEQAFQIPAIGFVVGFLGSVLCVLWSFNIRAYRRLVERKIKVILEMEAYLPFYCYRRENSIRKKELAEKTYLRPTVIEQFTSILFGVIYLILMIYSLLNFF